MGTCSNRKEVKDADCDGMPIFVATKECPNGVQLRGVSWSSTIQQIHVGLDQLEAIPAAGHRQLLYAGRTIPFDNLTLTGSRWASCESAFNEPISFVAFREVQLAGGGDQQTTVVWIDELYVSKGARRAGVGTWLMHTSAAGRPVELQVRANGMSARKVYCQLGLVALHGHERGQVYDYPQAGFVIMAAERLQPITAANIWSPREVDEVHSTTGWSKVDAQFRKLMASATMDAHGYTLEQATANLKGCGIGDGVKFIIIRHGAITLRCNMQDGDGTCNT